ncbi:MAG: Uma2 family endonuclease [Aggregatilineales bacterium]
MVVQAHPAVSIEEFEALITRPENAERLFEYIGGRAVEVPSNPLASKIAGIIFGELYIWLKTHDIGHLTGESGGYLVDGEKYAPDVAFVAYEKQQFLADKGYNPLPPDLAVEVISDPTNAQEQEDLRIKISHYMKAGTIVWVFDRKKLTVEVHQPGKSLVFVDAEGTLDGGTILPGFTLKVAYVFDKVR